MTDTITIIGTLATIQVASIGGLYLLMKAELNSIRTDIKRVDGSLANMKEILRAEMREMKAELKTDIREATRIVRP